MFRNARSANESRRPLWGQTRTSSLGAHVRFRRVQTLVRVGSPLVAIASAEALPSISARSIARPDTPKTSLMTLASLMLAVSRSFREPVAFGRLALHQLAAVAQQLAHLPQRLGRHETFGDQPVPDQIGDPLGILHVGLAPRHIADVSGVADDQLEMPLQDGIDRAPVDARALHPNVRHSRCPQPVPQRFEVPRHGAKRPHLLDRLNAGRADQKTRHDRLLMNVQAATPLNNHLHRHLLPSEGGRDAAGTFETLPCVLPVPGRDKEWYLYAARAGLLIGVANHRRDVSLNTIARGENRTSRPALPPFSPIMARRRRCLAA